MLRSLEPIRSSALPFDESSQFNAPQTFGAYRVLHQIGSGVLGPVFRTYEPQHDRLVAVKAFRLELVPEDVARVAERLRHMASAGQKHPGIVHVLDAGLQGSIAFLAMDYIAGETLDVGFRHLSPAPISRALPILRTMAGAIDASWAAGYGHGALHPRDIFFRAGSDDVIVTGFGIVPILETFGVKPQARRPYAAPERIAGEAATLSSDIYSLGAIAHELLTRRRPAGPGEQDGALATGVAPAHRPALKRALSTVLAERPEDRFATAADFVDALSKLEDNLAAASVPLFDQLEPTDKLPVLKDERAQATPEKTVEKVAETPVAPATSADKEIHLHDDGTLTPVNVVTNWEAALEHPPAPRPAADLKIERAAPPPPQPVVKDLFADSPPPEPSRDRRPLPPALFSSTVDAPPQQPATYPWGALLAASVACLTLGGVAGYQLGLRARPPVLVVNQPSSPAPAAGADVKAAPPISATPSPAPAAGATTAPATEPPLTAPPTVSEPTTPPATTPKPSPTPDRQTIDRGSTTKPASAKTGGVTINTRPPGARVIIDGKRVGVTPTTATGLTPGVHNVRIELAGYKTLPTKVTIKAGVTQRLNLSLEQGPPKSRMK